MYYSICIGLIPNWYLMNGLMLCIGSSITSTNMSEATNDDSSTVSSRNMSGATNDYSLIGSSDKSIQKSENDTAPRKNNPYDDGDPAHKLIRPFFNVVVHQMEVVNSCWLVQKYLSLTEKDLTNPDVKEDMYVCCIWTVYLSSQI